jgi:proteasome lid subunit RPN8/RPN11
VSGLSSVFVLRLTRNVFQQIVGHCYDGLPNEACGLFAGKTGGDLAEVCYPTDNVAASTKVYTVDPKQHLRADRDSEHRGMVIMGVFHSHTRTEAYPSPTDVAQAPDPTWHYVIVSLRGEAPTLRSYRIVDGNISEEPVVVTAR